MREDFSHHESRRPRHPDPKAPLDTIDAKVFGVKRPEDVPAAIQERAYTSPIWYTPKG